MSDQVDQNRFKSISDEPPIKQPDEAKRCWACEGRGQNWWFIGNAYPDYGSGWVKCRYCLGTGTEGPTRPLG